MNQYYPAKVGKEDWQWRIPFKTTTIDLDEELDKLTVFAKLDSCMQEIPAFESDLACKLSQQAEI